MLDRPKIKVVVEKHEDGYICYPIGLKGAVVGQGDTFEAALENTRSAIGFHIESFGLDDFGEIES